MIDHIDHIIITTDNEEACLHFYTEVLGMRLKLFGGPGRRALHFGNQKIHIHVKGREFEPKAHLPVPGALDICFIASVPLDTVIEKLNAAQIPIIVGPVMRDGATSRIRSVYVRDPDLNLIEIAELKPDE